MKRHLILGVMAVGLMACSGALPSEGEGSSSDKESKNGASTPSEVPPSAEGTAEGKPGEPPNAGGGGGYPGCDPSGGACFDVHEPQACGPYGKEVASKICGSKGLTPTAISQSPKGCVVTCCGGGGSGGGGKPQPPPPPKPPEPPPPPPSACSWQALGDGATCIGFADLKGQADAICQAQKANLTQLYSANDCPGGTTIAKVQCCWGATPPANGGGGGGGVPEPKK